jgi:hypothetical protein
MGFSDLLAAALVLLGMIPAHRAARAARSPAAAPRHPRLTRAIASIPIWCALALLVPDDGWALALVEWLWWIGVSGMACVLATPERRADRASTLARSTR